MRKRKFKSSLIRPVILGVILLIGIMVLGAAGIGYVVFTDVMQEQSRQTSNMTANVIANYVDADSLDTYLESMEKDDEYLETERVMQTIADQTDCSVIYVAKINPDEGTRTYIYDVVGKSSGLSQYALGYENTPSDDFIEGYNTLAEGAGELKHFFYGNSDEIGSYTTMIAPIYNSDGEMVAVCGVVKTLDGFISARSTFAEQLLILALVLALISGSIGIILLRRNVVLPIRKIADETARFASSTDKEGAGQLSEQINSNNEVGELAGAIDNMELSIINNVHELLEVSAEKNRIGTELDIATKIQSGVLPKISEKFPGRREMDVFAIMDPAKEIGGDFYDCFFTDEDHFAMVIADVSGKGIPAALFMMVSKLLIKNAAMENPDPAQALMAVNQRLCENNESNMFVTAWLGILDINTGEILAANAGHEYPIIMQADGQSSILKDKHGFVLGGMDSAAYKSYSIQLHSGEGIFLYTDGLPEAINEKEEQFGCARVIETLNNASETDPEMVITEILRGVGGFAGDVDQFDDTTILCMRYNGIEECEGAEKTQNNAEFERKNNMKEMTVDAAIENIEAVTDFVNEILEDKECPMKVQAQLGVVIDEILSNIAQYAYEGNPGTMTVQVDTAAPGQVGLHFIDSGLPYNPLENEDPDITSSAEERDIGGLGVFLAKNIMDELEYTYENGLNILTGIKKWAS